MQRIIGFMALLHDAQRRGLPGVPAEAMLASAGWEDAADGISAVNRDLNYLRSLGWRIENISPRGVSAVFRMTAVDNRLKLRLTAGQQAALRRAVLLADRPDLGDQLDLADDERTTTLPAAVANDDDPTLNTVIAAVRSKARLRFRYNGSERVVHPASLRTQQTKWYLRGHEDGSDAVKAFVVSRMREVYADAPGSASPLTVAGGPDRQGLHPLEWEIDPPVEVILRAPAVFAADMVRWLGTPLSTTTDDGQGEGSELLVYRVTNRAAMRSRLHQLATRVRVVGPDDFRAELLDELATMAGE